MTDEPITFDDHVASAKAMLQDLRGRQITQFPAYQQRPGEKLVRLTLLWQHSLLYRIVDVASASLRMFEAGRLVPGCTLARSVYESVAHLYYLHKKMAAFIVSPDIPAIANLVIRGSWGSKDESTEPEAIQVLTAINHLGKAYPGSEDEYFHLCEYAHPNFKGALGTYASMEIPSMNVEFGLNPQGLPMVAFGLGGLELILTVATEIFRDLQDLEQDFKKAVYENAEGKYPD